MAGKTSTNASPFDAIELEIAWGQLISIIDEAAGRIGPNVVLVDRSRGQGLHDQLA